MLVKDFEYQHLSIPRKPAWSKQMTAEDIDRREKQAFLVWRRTIADIEELHNHSKKVTPFEKNIEVWRQLWRVIDRSDIIIQVVDCRNPLLYYTDDLKRYVAELDPPKPMLLILNKADFLTEYQVKNVSAFVLRLRCSPLLFCVCATCALRLRCVCTAFALRLCYVCAAFAVCLHCVCTAFVLHLRCDCAAYALRLRCVCGALTLHLCRICAA
jgi:hypothetical protein